MNDLNRWFFAATRAQPVEILVLGFGRRQLQRLLQADACRQRRVNQRVERARADDAEHLGLLLFVRADVALFEIVRRIDGHVGALLHEFRVLIIIEQIVDLAGVAELDVVQPRAVGIFVDQFRLRRPALD